MPIAMTSDDTPRLVGVAVAYSGGRDSTALLHATARMAQAQGGLHVHALHVHHGLSAHADQWLAHAQATCEDWARQGLPLSFQARRVDLALAAGDSVEARARDVRYRALAEMAGELGVDLVLLAHHRRDQAETFFLQALRGASLKGLAAMPRDTMRGGVRWVRPWLDHPREAIDAYLALHGLAHVDDDSNASERFARNRLRLAVWPALQSAFPAAEVGLANAAARLQDCLPAWAAWRAGLLRQVTGPGGAADLDVLAWRELSGGERREALACWYQEVASRPLAATWVTRLAHELPGLADKGRAVRWAAPDLVLYRGVLRHEPVLAQAGEGAAAWPAPCDLSIDAPGEWALPAWRGRLRVQAVVSGGVPPELLRAGAQARARTGGEQFQAGSLRPPRALKKQFQSAGVPPWRRAGPLIWVGARLVFVPGLGVDARCVAPAGHPQWALDWLPDGG